MTLPHAVHDISSIIYGYIVAIHPFQTLHAHNTGSYLY